LIASKQSGDPPFFKTSFDPSFPAFQQIPISNWSTRRATVSAQFLSDQ
jgi:hypothetical protein